jgi:hypothetical protein
MDRDIHPLSRRGTESEQFIPTLADIEKLRHICILLSSVSLSLFDSLLQRFQRPTLRIHSLLDLNARALVKYHGSPPHFTSDFPKITLVVVYKPLISPQSAKIYGYDIWSKYFARNPFNKRAGRRWRKIVLEHHDTKVSWNPIDKLVDLLMYKIFGVPRTHMEALTKFMGRKPDSRAFVRALKAPANKNQTFWRRMGIRIGYVW